MPIFDKLLNKSCSILSQHGITRKFAHFLKGLRSWTEIQVKRKKLAEVYNRFSSIFRTSVIILYFLKIGQMVKTSI